MSASTEIGNSSPEAALACVDIPPRGFAAPTQQAPCFTGWPEIESGVPVGTRCSEHRPGKRLLEWFQTNVRVWADYSTVFFRRQDFFAPQQWRI